MHKMADRAACYQSWQAGGAEDVLSYVILDKGEMAQSSMVKRQFLHKGLRKGNLADNKWIGGRREHQSPQTHIFHGNTAEEEEGMEDQSFLTGEQMAKAVKGQCRPVSNSKICEVILEYALIFTCPSHVIK